MGISTDMTKPAIIRRYWYSIDWDVETIWHLDLPVRVFPIIHLLWHMHVPVWPDMLGHSYRITPIEVMNDPVVNHREYRRVMLADTSHPLDVFRNRNRIMILDGIHRLARLQQIGRRHVRARMIPDDMVRSIAGYH